MQICNLISLGLIGLLIFWSKEAYCQPPTPSNSTATLILSAGNWSAIDDNGNFKEIGASGQNEIMMEVEPVSPHFELHFIGYDPDMPLGTIVPVSVIFAGGQTFSFMTTQIFNGVEAQKDLFVQIPDDEMESWTHDLTALSTMAVTFSGNNNRLWTFDLAGTTPTITAMATAITAAGINDLPAPWTIPNAAQQPKNDTSSAPINQLAPTNKPAPSEVTFTDPEGIAYANLGETSWTTNKSYDEMKDQTDVTVVSDQPNDSGVNAQVTGECSNGVLTFSATITDTSGQDTINLANETLADNDGTSGEATMPDLIHMMTGAIGYVQGQLRINSDSEKQHTFFLFEYDNTPQIAQLSVGGSPANAFGVGGHLDLTTTWRILAELDTNQGKILLKIPLYDPQIEGLVKTCSIDDAQSGTTQ
jgi:hypothetical protein